METGSGGPWLVSRHHAVPDIALLGWVSVDRPDEAGAADRLHGLPHLTADFGQNLSFAAAADAPGVGHIGRSIIAASAVSDGGPLSDAAFSGLVEVSVALLSDRDCDSAVVAGSFPFDDVGPSLNILHIQVPAHGDVVDELPDRLLTGRRHIQ